MHPYSSPLLNELHASFPELLYRPEQFQTVQDVLQYIMHIANQNPYSQGRREYERQQLVQQSRPQQQSQSQPQQQSQSQPQQQSQRQPLQRPVTAASHSQSQSQSQSQPQFRPSPFLIRDLYQPIVRDPVIDIAPYLAGRQNPQPSILSALLNQVFAQPSSAFLEDTVVVRPTPAQLESNTTLRPATEHEDNNCAICQDPLEDRQLLCSINHCGHTFHEECIMPWFQQNVRCPTCRHDVREAGNRRNE
jgi:hypothetical protein